MSAPPDPTRALLDHALPFAERRDFAPLRRLLAGVPADPGRLARHLVESSYSEALEGRYRSSRTAALLAFLLDPKDAETRRQLAARLRTTNDVPELLELIRASGPASRIPIPLLLGYAAQLSYLNRQEQALHHLDEARRADPDYPPTLVSRGQVLTYLGRSDEACAEFERCIAIAPKIGQAHWFLSHVRRATPTDHRIDRLRAALMQTGLAPQEEASFAFALHKELDDLGDADGAWQALTRACAAKRGTLKYDAADTRRLVDALVALPPRTVAADDEAGGTPVPIFIVGMHRSGTTLVEQLLDASPQVQGIGEMYDFTCAMRHATDHPCRGVIDLRLVERARAADLANAGRRYLDGLAWRLDARPFFTDKLPTNFFHLDFLCAALPQARILHLVRDPMETCFSNLRELFSDANAHSYDMGELADYYLQYRRLMAHWHARHPGRILDVDYARLTREPDAVMREVSAFCGIDYVDAMRDPRSSTRAVATASALQVREGVVRRDQPKWAPYAHRLQPLADALARGGISGS